MLLAGSELRVSELPLAQAHWLMAQRRFAQNATVTMSRTVSGAVLDSPPHKTQRAATTLLKHVVSQDKLQVLSTICNASRATRSGLVVGIIRIMCNVLVATVDYQENPHLCMQILHASMFQFFRGAYILLRVLAVTESQERQGLLDEIQQQPRVFVLSAPATVITNVATASAFLADG